MSKQAKKLKGIRKSLVKRARRGARKTAPISYSCPCCGYKTLVEEPPGTYDICKICLWEDDPVQFDDPDYVGGANSVSLRQAQRNFLEFGVSKRSIG